MEALKNAIAAPTDVQRRLIAYLRCLGIDNPETLSRLSANILTRTANHSFPRLTDEAPLDLLLRVKEEWFQVLTHLGAEDSATLNEPLVGWRLRQILIANPDALLAPPIDPAGFSSHSHGPGVPPSCHAIMPAQTLGEVPVLMQTGFWRHVAFSFKQTWFRVTSHFIQE